MLGDASPVFTGAGSSVCFSHLYDSYGQALCNRGARMIFCERVKPAFPIRRAAATKCESPRMTDPSRLRIYTYTYIVDRQIAKPVSVPVCL